MTEIDPGLRAISAVAGIAGLAGPMIWYVLRRRFWTITLAVFLVFAIAALLGSIWSSMSDIGVGYDGETPTFVNLLTYYLRRFGLVFVGLSSVFFFVVRVTSRNDDSG